MKRKTKVTLIIAVIVFVALFVVLSLQVTIDSVTDPHGGEIDLRELEKRNADDAIEYFVVSPDYVANSWIPISIDSISIINGEDNILKAYYVDLADEPGLFAGWTTENEFKKTYPHATLVDESKYGMAPDNFAICIFTKEPIVQQINVAIKYKVWGLFEKNLPCEYVVLSGFPPIVQSCKEYLHKIDFPKKDSIEYLIYETSNLTYEEYLKANFRTKENINEKNIEKYIQVIVGDTQATNLGEQDYAVLLVNRHTETVCGYSPVK